MNKIELDRALSILATIAAAIVIAMIAGILTTRISQDFFQSARSAAELTARITADPGSSFGLRLNLGLDNLFVLVYGAFFVLLAMRFRSSMDPWMSAVALGAMLLTVFLDMVENHHIAMMLHSIEHMLPLSVEESRIQMMASGVKFHSSYVAVFLFACGFCKKGTLGRWIARIIWAGYLPLGILMSVAPVELTKPLAFARVTFFVLVFMLSAALFARSRKQQLNGDEK